MVIFHTEGLKSNSNDHHNRLLASLPVADYERLAPHLRRMPMRPRQVLHRQHETIQNIYFPAGGACSLVKTLEDGRASEVATIGSEGVVGASIFFGGRVADCDVLVQLAGPGIDVLSADDFNAEMERRGAFFNHVIRYNQALMSQVMQTTACNGLHSAEQRCSRWLLMMHDRAGTDEFPVTHELIAAMLAVRRPTVTLICGGLQARGLIQHRRGTLTILDRAGLEAVSCECYGSVTTTWRRLLPDVGPFVQTTEPRAEHQVFGGGRVAM